MPQTRCLNELNFWSEAISSPKLIFGSQNYGYPYKFMSRINFRGLARLDPVITRPNSVLAFQSSRTLIITKRLHTEINIFWNRMFSIALKPVDLYQYSSFCTCETFEQVISLFLWWIRICTLRVDVRHQRTRLPLLRYVLDTSSFSFLQRTRGQNAW